MLDDRRAALLSLLPPVLATLSIAYWYTKALEGQVFMGLCQWEQVIYLATAREFVEHGSWLFYPSPYAVESDFPAVYSHLFQVLLGYVWRFTGLSLTQLWWASRLVLGPVMFYLGYKILREFFDGVYLRTGFLMLLFGGGLAYFHAFFGSLVFGQGFFESLHMLEGPYDWWFTNLFRVSFYPLEIFAHIMLFASMLFFIRKRFALSALFYFLTWWAHPITAAMLTSIYAVFFVLEILVFKERELARSALPFIPIAGLFLFYYLILIPSFPMAAALAENFKTLENMNAMHLNPLLYTSAWGIFIVAPLLLTRASLFASHRERFVLYWVLVEFILINNDVLFPQSMVHQPMHFTRGNLFFPLLILALLGLRRVLESSFKSRAPVILAILLALALPDNALFLHQFMTVGGDYRIPEDTKLNPLKLSDAQWDTVQALDRLESEEVVLSYDVVLGVMLPAYTQHRSLLGPYDYTPYFDEKLEDSRAFFRANDSRVLEKYGVTVVVFPKTFENLPDGGEVYHENDGHVVWVRVNE